VSNQKLVEITHEDLQPNLDPGHHCAVRERDGEVALAHARWAEQHNVLGALDEAQSGELLDLGARCARGEAEVILLERLDRRQRRELEHRLAPALEARVVLGGKHPLEEVREACFLLRGLLRDRRPLRSAHRAELQTARTAVTIRSR
jgi:hypothetical protein